MADGIQISTQVLLDTADKVRTINSTLDQKLADINKNMNDLEARVKIITIFTSLQPHFSK